MAVYRLPLQLNSALLAGVFSKILQRSVYAPSEIQPKTPWDPHPIACQSPRNRHERSWCQWCSRRGGVMFPPMATKDAGDHTEGLVATQDPMGRGPLFHVPAPPAPAPAFCASNVPCLRGPCRHYFEIWGHFEHGNPPDTPGIADGQLRVRAMSCMRVAGKEFDLSADAPILACNQWDPLLPDDLDELERRRARWRRSDRSTR